MIAFLEYLVQNSSIILLQFSWWSKVFFFIYGKVFLTFFFLINLLTADTFLWCHILVETDWNCISDDCFWGSIKTPQK